MLINSSQNSKNRPAAALVLLSMGLLVLSCGVAWQHAFAPHFHLSAGPNDFIHGFCMGLGLTLEVIALVMLVRVSRERPQA